MSSLTVQQMQKLAGSNPVAKQLIQQWEAGCARIEADLNNKLTQKIQLVATVVPSLSKNGRDLDAWERLRDVCEEAIEIIDPSPLETEA